MAGLLLGAILSDTLKFRSPTTTGKDIGLARTLATIAGLDIDTFAREMFKVSCNISHKSVHDLISQDVKTFQIDNKKVMIAQVIIAAVDEVRSIEADLRSEMEQFTLQQGLDLFVVAFTSIVENGSIFYASGRLQEIVTEAFPNENGEHSFQEDILSRKNQIVPLLSRAIINASI